MNFGQKLVAVYYTIVAVMGIAVGFAFGEWYPVAACMLFAIPVWAVVSWPDSNRRGDDTAASPPTSQPRRAGSTLGRSVTPTQPLCRQSKDS